MTTFYCSSFEHNLLSEKPNSSAQRELDIQNYQTVQLGELR